jgi:hypothetical protein
MGGLGMKKHHVFWAGLIAILAAHAVVIRFCV